MRQNPSNNRNYQQNFADTSVLFSNICSFKIMVTNHNKHNITYTDLLK